MAEKTAGIDTRYEEITSLSPLENEWFWTVVHRLLSFKRSLKTDLDKFLSGHLNGA